MLDRETLRKLKESNYNHPEIIEIIFDNNIIYEMSIDAIKLSKIGFNLVWDSILCNFCLKKFTPGLELVYQKVQEKGIKIKLIVEATKENVDYLDKLKYHDIRCIDHIRGNFGIFDNVAYMVHIFHKENDYPDQTFFSNSKALVEKQLALFEKMWDIAIPLSDKQKDLEYANKTTKYPKIITNHNQVQKEIDSLMEQSRKELIILSSASLLHTIINNKTRLNSLESIIKKDVFVKILTNHIDDALLNYLVKLNRLNKNNPVQLGYSNKLGIFDELVMVTDNRYLLRVKWDQYNNNLVATFSNEEHQVLVQEILFEKYWNEIKSLLASTTS